MSKNSILLVDPNFNAEATTTCNLLLKVTNDSFSYAIIDENSGQINAIFDKQGFRDIGYEVRTAFENDKFLSLKYSKIKAAIHTSNFAFIPNDWFDAENLAVYSKYLGSDGKIYSRPNDTLGFNTVFCLDEDVKSKLPEQTLFLPQSEPLIALLNHLNKDALLIDFTATSFSALLIKDEKIVFQNHYQAETVEEFNYFLLLIIEQLKLDDSIPVYLQGIINEDDDHYNCLLKYFNQIYFFLPAGKQDSELLADMPKHYFSNLLALDLCE
jgi:hypothetical protein